MCEIEWGEYEPFQYYVESERRARKPAGCTVCAAVITPGMRYTFVSAMFEGEPHTYKVCPACQVERIAFKDEHHGNTDPGSFTDVLGECLDTALDEHQRAPFERWMRVYIAINARSGGRHRRNVEGYLDQAKRVFEGADA